MLSHSYAVIPALTERTIQAHSKLLNRKHNHKLFSPLKASNKIPYCRIIGKWDVGAGNNLVWTGWSESITCRVRSQPCEEQPRGRSCLLGLESSAVKSLGLERSLHVFF